MAASSTSYQTLEEIARAHTQREVLQNAERERAQQSIPTPRRPAPQAPQQQQLFDPPPVEATAPAPAPETIPPPPPDTPRDPLDAAWRAQLDRPRGPGGEALGWVPDRSATACMVCTARFTLLRRRHHCRRCGACVCGDCSKARLPLNLMPERRARGPGDPNALAPVPTTRPGDPPRPEAPPALGARVAQRTYRTVAKDTNLGYVRCCTTCAKVVDDNLKAVIRRRAAPLRRGTFDETEEVKGDGEVVI